MSPESNLDTHPESPSAFPRRLRLMGVVSGKCLVWLVSGFFLGALGGAIAGAALGAFLGLIIGGSVEVPRSAAAVGAIGLVTGALTGILIVPLRLLEIELRFLVAGTATLTGAVVGAFLGGFEGAGIFAAVGAITGILFILALRFIPGIRTRPQPTPNLEQ